MDFVACSNKKESRMTIKSSSVIFLVKITQNPTRAVVLKWASSEAPKENKLFC